MRCFLIILVLFGSTVYGQELTPAQIAIANKADSLALSAWNFALKNVVYSLNSALGKTNTALVAKNRAQDSIIALIRTSEKALKDTNVAQSKVLVSLIAKNLAQDKLIVALTAKNKSEDSLRAIMQKQIAAIKITADKAAVDAAVYSTIAVQPGMVTLKASITKKNYFTLGIDTAFSNPVKLISGINTRLKKIESGGVQGPIKAKKVTVTINTE